MKTRFFKAVFGKMHQWRVKWQFRGTTATMVIMDTTAIMVTTGIMRVGLRRPCSARHWP
jgi:ATP-dependent protease HslVU (ClpYQ) peptidase subunit